ncbi:MAG: NAD(P)(+) transhydrogenase (Re/Si-specific) subunit beta [Crocinitomicaceae bacterium]|nr:NAD(P)(+) transhydrogenase (Re/Si-specific) subunit beta [Crocinitomicaceae bacterium]
MTLLINIFFLLASVGLIVGIKLMGNPIRAKIGNVVALLAMFIAIVATDILLIQDSYKTINLILLISAISAGTLIGYYFSYRVEMTAMPQLVSLFNAFGGACAVIIGFNEALNYYHEPTIVSALILISELYWEVFLSLEVSLPCINFQVKSVMSMAGFIAIFQSCY